MFKKLLFLVFLLLFGGNLHAQETEKASEVYVESWTVGSQIREAKLEFVLDSPDSFYKQYVRDYRVGRYWLFLRHKPADVKNRQLEYWYVELKEILSKEDAKKEKLGCNLLRASVCGVSDYFPREDNVADLYPREEPLTVEKTYLDLPYYPISSRRVIKVKNFYVIIQVNDYKMNTADPEKLDSMNVTVELRNTYIKENASK